MSTCPVQGQVRVSPLKKMYKMVLPVSMWVPLGTSCGHQPLPFLEPLDDQVGPLVVTVENVEVVVGHVTPEGPGRAPVHLT